LLHILRVTDDLARLAQLFRLPGWDVDLVQWAFGSLSARHTEQEFNQFVSFLEFDQCAADSLNALVDGLVWNHQHNFFEKLPVNSLLSCIEQQSAKEKPTANLTILLMEFTKREDRFEQREVGEYYKSTETFIPEKTAEILIRAMILFLRNNHENAEIMLLN